MTRAARRPQALRGEILSPAEAAHYLASGGVDVGTADAMPAPAGSRAGEPTIEATLPTPREIAIRTLARSLGYGDTPWVEIPADVRARLEAAGAVAEIDAARPGTVDPRLAVRTFFDPAFDPFRTPRDAALVAEQRLESFGAERAPGLVAVAKAHPVATFAAGVASGGVLAWIFGGKS